jgi:succinoglycan biosynthesis protein ExoA
VAGTGPLPPPPPPEEVLVAIPALDEAEAIGPCLRSLLEGDAYAARTTIVVADGGSTDGTQAVVRRLAARFPALRLMHNPGRLQSAGVNRVAEACAGPHHRVLVRCDGHAIYPPGYVARVAAALAARPEAASVATVMDATGGPGFARAAAWAVDTPLGSGGSAHRGGRRSGWVDHGHHAGFRLDWFRQIGGYDESFSHNEDAEFDHRLALAGGKVWLDSDIRLDYAMRPAPRALWRQYWNYGRGRSRTIVKHRTRPRLRQLAPALHTALIVPSLALAPLWPPALGYAAAYSGALAGASLWCAADRRETAGLWAGPALGVMHLAWGLGFLTGLARAARPVSRAAPARSA